MNKLSGASKFSRQMFELSDMPVEFIEEDNSMNDAQEALIELEKFLSEDKNEKLCFEELQRPFSQSVARVLMYLDEHSIKLAINYDKLVKWLVIEILNTGIEYDELPAYLNHDPTLEEVIYGNGNPEDKDNIFYYIKTGNYGQIRTRYNDQEELLKEKFNTYFLRKGKK